MPKKSEYIWATFGRKCAAKNLQKLPNLVTLVKSDRHVCPMQIYFMNKQKFSARKNGSTLIQLGGAQLYAVLNY